MKKAFLVFFTFIISLSILEGTLKLLKMDYNLIEPTLYKAGGTAKELVGKDIFERGEDAEVL